MLMLKLSARCWWHFAEVLGLLTYVCHKGKGCVCSQTLNFLHKRPKSRWPGKKIEQRSLQHMAYIPLKVVKLHRKLQNREMERGRGRFCVGEERRIIIFKVAVKKKSFSGDTVWGDKCKSSEYELCCSAPHKRAQAVFIKNSDCIFEN